MKNKEHQTLEVDLPKQVILRLFEEGQFLANCRDKQDILCEGSEYCLRKSEDKELWVLIQKIDGKSITWGSMHFAQIMDAHIVDHLLSIKKNENVDTKERELPKSCSRAKRKRFRSIGMHQGWEC